MSTRVITLLAVFGALAVGAARAQVVLAPTIFHTADLPSNAITNFIVACPPGHVAVSAGVFRPAPGTTLLASRPVTLRAYSFRVGNPVKHARQHVTVSNACRKVRAPGSAPLVLRLRLLRTRLVNVPPGTTGSASLTCPAGMVSAGSGEDLDPQRRAKGFLPGFGTHLSLRRATASARSFSFAVRNSGSTSLSVVLYGSCVTVVRQPGNPRERLHIRITTFTETVHPGPQTIVRRCPRGWVSVAAGFALHSPLTSLTGAAAVGVGGRWSLVSDARGPAAVDLQLSCARLAAD
jgi:hypothetical protein